MYVLPNFAAAETSKDNEPSVYLYVVFKSKQPLAFSLKTATNRLMYV